MSEKAIHTQSAEPEESVPFFPDHVSTELRVVAGILVLVVVVGLLGVLAPIGLNEPADPLNTPEHVKPEWYFLSLYQVLKFIPKTAGAVLPVILLLLLALLPFLDRRQDRSPRTQRMRLYGVIVALIVIVALTLWGELS